MLAATRSSKRSTTSASRFTEGERVGLIGHNGSGKTTLLRTLSGVYAPVRGELKVQGKIASLLDVSMGLDPDATGFENIYLRGILDGLKPARIRSKIDEIADFSELGDYLNLPVRTYSSGMMLRLAFAISTSVEADILIMDEWLSVGDAEFSIKAAERLEGLVGKASIAGGGVARSEAGGARVQPQDLDGARPDDLGRTREPAGKERRSARQPGRAIAALIELAGQPERSQDCDGLRPRAVVHRGRSLTRAAHSEFSRFMTRLRRQNKHCAEGARESVAARSAGAAQA